MANRDHGVDLRSRLAQLDPRRDDDDEDDAPSPQQRVRPRSRSNCRNPECVNGMAPGLVATGKGKAGAPLFGEGGVGAKGLMRWGWLSCPACKPQVGAPYRALRLSPEEIARRAELATAKASYSPPTPQDRLGKIPRSMPNGAYHSASQDDSKLAELLDTNKKLSEQVTQLTAQLSSQGAQFAQMNETLSRMTMQVASLLEDNAKLRKELESRPATATQGANT